MYNIGVTACGGQIQAWAWGRARELLGTLWPQVCRKGQPAGQTNTKAF